jgi:predicted transposase YbfD/YdcC
MADVPGPKSLLECFSVIPDPRVDRTRVHKLIDILVIGICTMISIGEGFADMEWFGKTKQEWLKGFLELPGGIPSHDTFNRVFSAIDPECFLGAFVSWVQGICKTLDGEVVAIDGKALRRAHDAGAPLTIIVNAWAVDAGLTLGQIKVSDKSNEITAIPPLLRALHLNGCIVTLDAMGCQKKVAAQIVEKQADYVLALKGNHQVAEAEVAQYFDYALAKEQSLYEADGPEFDFFESIEKDHGRIETRRCWQTTDVDWFEDKNLWKGLRSFGMVESIREIGGHKSVERRYFLSSLALDAKKLGSAVRKHWAVENSLHWTLDMTFGEDQGRSRARNAAENLALLRRLALNLIKNDKSKKASIKNKRALAAMDHKFMEQLLGIF